MKPLQKEKKGSSKPPCDHVEVKRVIYFGNFQGDDTVLCCGCNETLSKTTKVGYDDVPDPEPFDGTPEWQRRVAGCAHPDDMVRGHKQRVIVTRRKRWSGARGDYVDVSRNLDTSMPGHAWCCLCGTGRPFVAEVAAPAAPAAAVAAAASPTERDDHPTLQSQPVVAGDRGMPPPAPGSGAEDVMTDMPLS
jgi:hypothetical protein